MNRVALACGPLSHAFFSAGKAARSARLTISLNDKPVRFAKVRRPRTSFRESLTVKAIVASPMGGLLQILGLSKIAISLARRNTGARGHP